MFEPDTRYSGRTFNVSARRHGLSRQPARLFQWAAGL